MLHVRRERFLPEAGTGQVSPSPPKLSPPALRCTAGKARARRGPTHSGAAPRQRQQSFPRPRSRSERVGCRLRKRVFVSAAVFPGASAAQSSFALPSRLRDWPRMLVAFAQKFASCFSSESVI